MPLAEPMDHAHSRSITDCFSEIIGDLRQGDVGRLFQKVPYHFLVRIDAMGPLIPSGLAGTDSPGSAIQRHPANGQRNTSPKSLGCRPTRKAAIDSIDDPNTKIF